MKQRHYLLLATALSCAALPAQADFMGGLKKAFKEDSAAVQESLNNTESRPLTSLLSDKIAAFAPDSAGNAAGILQYCVEQKLLAQGDTSALKDKLLGKLGLSDATASKDSAYQDGLKGILNTSEDGKINLGNAGSAMGKLTDNLKKKACDTVLSQAASFL